MSKENKIQAKQQPKLLPQLLENPRSLVGQQISHRCQEEDGTVEWFSAKVKDIKL